MKQNDEVKKAETIENILRMFLASSEETQTKILEEAARILKP